MSNRIIFNKDLSPNSGCEFVVSINKNGQLILTEREIRLGFQSPRPNPENRGELRIIDRVSEFNIESSFIKEMTVRTSKELPVNARPSKANVKPITINTNMKNIYYEAILTHIYDDNE